MILSEFSEIIRQISKIYRIYCKVFSPIHIIYIGVLNILENELKKFIIRPDGIIFKCNRNSKWKLYNTQSKSDWLFITQSKVQQADCLNHAKPMIFQYDINQYTWQWWLNNLGKSYHSWTWTWISRKSIGDLLTCICLRLFLFFLHSLKGYWSSLTHKE